MRFVSLLLPVLLMGIIFSQTCAANPTAQEIMVRSDQIRNPAGAFRFTVRITEFRSGVARDTMSVSIHSKPGRSGGQYRSLVKINHPLRDRGKLVLRNGNNLWFYDPAAKTSVRISPQQRLLGQASNGDVMTTNFARDYESRLVEKMTIRDADKNQRDCFLMELIATHHGVSYPRIEYWVDQQTFQPVKGRFYADSGRMLKTVYYRRFEPILGEVRPTEVLIIDGVDREKITRMQFAQYAIQQIPEYWFQRDYLPRFEP